MLRQIDPEAASKYVPTCEANEEAPTVFYIKPEGMRSAILRHRLYTSKYRQLLDGTREVTTETAHPDNWVEYFQSRISRIENARLITIGKDGQQIEERRTLIAPAEIMRFLEFQDDAHNIVDELFKYMDEHRGLEKQDAKN